MFEVFLHICEEERWHVLQKFIHKIIRAAIDRFLHSPPHNKPFSIISGPAFTEANNFLDAFVKDLRKTGKIAGVVHKKAISKEQLKKLFESGELGPADSLNPAQLQRTAWFYLGLFFGRRERENQRQLTPALLSLRKTPQGVEYYELNRSQPGSLPATKNHQGGLADAEDESDAKIFSVPGSERTTWAISIQRQMLCFRDQEMVKARSSIPQTTKSGFAAHLLAQLRSTT